MKSIYLLLVVWVMVILGALGIGENTWSLEKADQLDKLDKKGGEVKVDLQKTVEGMHWLGQATFKFAEQSDGKIKVIYFDPFEIKNSDRADVVFITHSHFDHFDLKSLGKITNEQTTIVAPAEVSKQIKDIKGIVKTVKPGDKLSILGVDVEAVPAYNVKKSQFHAKDKGWVGYIVKLNGVRVYHAGDTERIPEMKNFKADIALLPLGQVYTMNSVEEAAEAAMDVGAKWAIPMHYGKAEGKLEDALKFQKLLEGKIKVAIKDRE